MEKKCFKHALPVKSLLTMLLFVLLALPSTSFAVPIMKLEFKALPDVFISGATLDLPLYLVENRDATESSRFSGYPSSPPFTVEGPFPLASIYSELTSTQSQFVSFTPIAGFDIIFNTNNFVADHEMVFDMRSTNGIPVVVDNSGIVGRTEILIGTVRVVVGPPIPQDDGIGGPDPAAVFWVDLSAQTNQGHNASLYLGPSGTDNVGELALGGIHSSTYKILEAPKPMRGTVQYTFPTFLATESDGNAQLCVSRIDGSYGTASAKYATANGTAIAGSDYTAKSGTLSWADGDAADKCYSVAILNGTVSEDVEEFTASLSGVTGASLGSPESATVWIIDDDLPTVTITANDATATEGRLTTDSSR